MVFPNMSGDGKPCVGEAAFQVEGGDWQYRDR